MKQLIPFFLFILLTLQIQAQADLVVEPNPYLETFLIDFSNPNASEIAYGIFTNTSDQTMNVKWELITSGTNCPEEWDFKICDKNNCNIYGVATNYGGPVTVPVELNPGDTSVLQLYFKPNGVSGCGQPMIQLSNINDATNIIATADYDVCVENATDVSEREKSTLRVFPNPTANFISVSNNNFVKKIWISNILGKRVQAFATHNGSSYDVSHLPDGIYLVSMVDEYNKVVKTVRISKRNIRP